MGTLWVLSKKYAWKKNPLSGAEIKFPFFFVYFQQLFDCKGLMRFASRALQTTKAKKIYLFINYDAVQLGIQ